MAAKHLPTDPRSLSSKATQSQRKLEIWFRTHEDGKLGEERPTPLGWVFQGGFLQKEGWKGRRCGKVFPVENF